MYFVIFESQDLMGLLPAKKGLFSTKLKTVLSSI